MFIDCARIFFPTISGSGGGSSDICLNSGGVRYGQNKVRGFSINRGATKENRQLVGLGGEPACPNGGGTGMLRDGGTGMHVGPEPACIMGPNRHALWDPAEPACIAYAIIT